MVFIHDDMFKVRTMIVEDDSIGNNDLVDDDIGDPQLSSFLWVENNIATPGHWNGFKFHTKYLLSCSNFLASQ